MSGEPMFHEMFIDDEGSRLAFAAQPARGRPLVLLHGVTRRWQSFVPLLPGLMTRWQVLALDFRGHGRSANVTDAYRVVDYVDDALRLIQQLDQPAVVYGHSLGAMVAAAVAGRAPDRVRAVVLEDPPLHTMGQRIGQTALLSFFRGMHELAVQRPDLESMLDQLTALELVDPVSGNRTRLGAIRDACSLRFTASCLKQLDPDVLKPIVESRWLDGFNVPAVFAALQCPALLLQADPQTGGMLIDDDVHELRALAPRMMHIPFSGTGHLIHWQQTQALLNTVTGFLESLPEAP